MIVADSDVLIDALHGVEPARSRVEEALTRRRLAVAAVTRFELLAGVRSAEQKERVERLLSPLATLPFDREAAELAAAAAVELAAGGRTVPMADLAIAGTCLALDVALLTQNVRHFRWIAGLRVEEP